MNAREHITAIWAVPPQPLGGSGFALPTLTNFEWHAVGEAGGDNWVVAAPDVNWRTDITIDIPKKFTGNVIVYGRGSCAKGNVVMRGNDNVLICGENNLYHFNFTAYCSGNNGLIFFGARSTSNGFTMWTHGTDTKVIIGEDVMIAHGIIIRTSDDHAMIDVETGSHLNPPQSVHVDPHVWLCPEVHLLKGARIGYGSIIGERSVVTGPIGRYVLAAGVPARPLREGVSWDRPLFPRPNAHTMIANFGLSVD